MSFVNFISKEINCKIVYYGPGLGGKTTNIQHIYQKTNHARRGEMMGLHQENDRTLFFDFLPLELGEVNGLKTRFHLYTVPGQVFYEASRKLILRGVDGIIFVADSQIERMEANMESMESLKNNLIEHHYDIKTIPYVIQWNKRDLPNIVSLRDLRERLNQEDAPEFEAVALKGEGVFETLKAVSKMVLLNIKGGLKEI
jgi:signal recognition particle receptor subunit beta